jgi:AcrR family transcriptional regulator
MREDVLATAFQMIKEQSIDGLSARNLAQRVGCSTQPIFSIFSSMDECKTEVYHMAVDYLKSFMWRGLKSDSENIEKLMQNYVLFASKEPNLFKAIFDSECAEQNQSYMHEKLINEKMSRDMFIYAHGLADIVAHSGEKYLDQAYEQCIMYVHGKLEA